MENYKTSESMQKFFDNLISLKERIKEKYEETKDLSYKEFYEEFDRILKVSEEK